MSYLTPATKLKDRSNSRNNIYKLYRIASHRAVFFCDAELLVIAALMILDTRYYHSRRLQAKARISCRVFQSLLLALNPNYSAPVGERSIAISQSVSLSVYLCVCVCVYVFVCPRAYLWSGSAGPILTKFVARIPCGSVLLWRRCYTLCTSGFMDDVTFGRSCPYGGAWLAALRYRGGV